MSQKTLSTMLKAIIIGVAACCVLVYTWIVPEIGCGVAGGAPEFAHLYTPWLIIIFVTAIPVAGILVLAWIISSNIGHDKSFSQENAKLLKWVSLLAGIDALYFFIANIVMCLLRASHPGLVILALLSCFVAVCVSVAAAVLSHLVYKAAKLQTQSDLTI